MGEKVEINSFESYIRSFFKVLIDYSPKLISAIIILFVGLYAVNFITKLVKKLMLRRNVETTLANFVSDIVFWGLRVLLFVTFISKLGIETSSFVAILGAAGLAIGMAFQGSLSNFAGGMLIVLFKPFKDGDTIEFQNITGVVSDIQIFSTKIISATNQTIFIPNGILSNGIIINYSMLGIRKTDIQFSVSYNTNLKDAKDIIMNVLNNHPKIEKTPEPSVSVKDLTDNTIHLSIKCWTKSEDYGDVVSNILENCKAAFDEKRIAFQPSIKNQN